MLMTIKGFIQIGCYSQMCIVYVLFLLKKISLLTLFIVLPIALQFSPVKHYVCYGVANCNCYLKKASYFSL